jgi:hypothetical protein
MRRSVKVSGPAPEKNCLRMAKNTSPMVALSTGLSVIFFFSLINTTGVTVSERYTTVSHIQPTRSIDTTHLHKLSCTGGNGITRDRLVMNASDTSSLLIKITKQLANSDSPSWDWETTGSKSHAKKLAVSGTVKVLPAATELGRIHSFKDASSFRPRASRVRESPRRAHPENSVCHTMQARWGGGTCSSFKLARRMAGLHLKPEGTVKGNPQLC